MLMRSHAAGTALVPSQQMQQAGAKPEGSRSAPAETHSPQQMSRSAASAARRGRQRQCKIYNVEQSLLSHLLCQPVWKSITHQQGLKVYRLHRSISCDSAPLLLTLAATTQQHQQATRVGSHQHAFLGLCPDSGWMPVHSIAPMATVYKH